MHGVVLFFVFTHFQMSKTCPIIHSGDSFLMYRNGLTSFHAFQILNFSDLFTSFHPTDADLVEATILIPMIWLGRYIYSKAPDIRKPSTKKLNSMSKFK